jgi:hypothetical protein
MQVENGGGVNCFELHPNLQGSAADQTTSKEAALLLCCISGGARYLREQAPRQRANLLIQNADENGPDIYLTNQSPVRLFSVLAKDKQNGEIESPAAWRQKLNEISFKQQRHVALYNPDLCDRGR